MKNRRVPAAMKKIHYITVEGRSKMQKPHQVSAMQKNQRTPSKVFLELRPSFKLAHLTLPCLCSLRLGVHGAVPLDRYLVSR
jgi:hypothetical protein